MKMTTKKIVLMGLFIAMAVVLTMVSKAFFAIPLTIGFTDRIDLGFFPIALSGIMCGFWGGGVCAGATDILCALFVPQGVPDPIFTANAVLRGSLYGFLHKRFNSVTIIAVTTFIFIAINVLLMSVIMKLRYFPALSLGAVILAKLPVAAANYILNCALLLITRKPLERNILNAGK